MTQPNSARISIVGTVGVPANYGGFETLTENLVKYHSDTAAQEQLVVYCSTKAYEDRPDTYLSAKLRYVPLDANGSQSILYDIWSMLSAVRKGTDTILILGVSGTFALPFIRAISKARIVTNIDGIEWRREKWGKFQRWFLKKSEAMAVRMSHIVIADNGAIADYVREAYGKECEVIAYGGDHAILSQSKPLDEIKLPDRYAFNVCRIEPENNVHLMLEAFEDRSDFPLVCVGNWDRSPYGVELKERFAQAPGLRILDPIYDTGKLKTLRLGATAYIHGHSAGGTNPSLVEMMHFGSPVFAFDCDFNRYTTEEAAFYFKDATDLGQQLLAVTPNRMAEVGASMKTIAEHRYTWDAIGRAYYELLR